MRARPRTASSAQQFSNYPVGILVGCDDECSRHLARPVLGPVDSPNDPAELAHHEGARQVIPRVGVLIGGDVVLPQADQWVVHRAAPLRHPPLHLW